MQLRIALAILALFLVAANPPNAIEIMVRDLSKKAEEPKEPPKPKPTEVRSSAPAVTYEYIINDLILEFRRQLKDKITQMITNFSWQKSTDGKSIEFLSKNRSACGESFVATEYVAVSRISLTNHVETVKDTNQKKITTTAEYYACNTNAVRFKEILVVIGKDIEPLTLDQFMQNDIKVTLAPSETYRFYGVELRGQHISAITSTKVGDRTVIRFEAGNGRMHDITIYERKNDNKIDLEAYSFVFNFETSYYERNITTFDTTKYTVIFPKTSSFAQYLKNDTVSIAKSEFNIGYQALFVIPITQLHAQLFTNLVASFPITSVDTGVSKDSEFFNELTRILTVRLTKPNPTDVDIRDVRRFFEVTRDKILNGKLTVTEQK